MKSILVIVAVTILYGQCTKTSIEIPACIQQRIEEIKSQPVANPPIQIDEYEYKGQRTFLISSPCCDQHNILYDANCNYICAPTGGITGRGDGKCLDFLSVAKHIKLIWIDERGQ